jgi:hypothetical protein
MVRLANETDVLCQAELQDQERTVSANAGAYAFTVIAERFLPQV